MPRTTGSGAVRRWQVVLCLAILLPLGVLSFLNRATSLHGDDGVRWVEENGCLRAARVGHEGPGETAGIQPWDRLVSIDGIRVERIRELRDLLWGRGGVASTYLLLRGESLESRRIVPALNGEENRFFYYLCLVGVLGLGAGSLAAWRLPGDSATFLLLALSAAFYSILVFSPGGGGGILDWTMYWGDLAGRLLAAPLLIHFVMRVADDDAGRPGVAGRIALYLPATALLILNVCLIPLRWALSFPDPVATVALKDRLELLTISAYGTTAAVLLLLRLWTATRSRIRWRLKWLALSAGAGLLPPTLLYGIPVALKIPPGTVGELAVFAIGLVPLGFAAALFQERTLDLDRTLRGAVRWTLGAAAFLGGALVFSWSLGHLPGGSREAGILTEVVLPLAASGLVMVAFRRRMRRLTDALLGTAPPGVNQALLEFRSVLNGGIHLEELGEGFLGKLRDYFHVEPASLFVREGTGCDFRRVPEFPGRERIGSITLSLGPEVVFNLAPKEVVLLAGDRDKDLVALAPLHACGFRYLFPLTIGRELNAVLLTGPHGDGSPLGAEEIEVLAVLSSQAARGVEGARLYLEIAERIEKEEKLRAQSQGILEASGVGILLADGRGVVTQANRAAGEILGHPDSPGKPLSEVLPRGLLLLLDRSSRDERSWGGQGRVYRYSFGGADGRIRIVNVSRAPLVGKAGGGQVYTLDDITEEARREEKMLRQDHLASIGVLASQVAHEVNTPLTGIASYAQILMSRMSARVPEMDLLRKIEAQAFRAAGIAGSVLSFSRRRDGEAPQILEPGPVVAECLTLFETHMKGKKIRMTTERAASLPNIRGHRGRIQQAVINLLMNAAEALPQGGEIRLGMDREGESLRIRVTDNGVGIPSDILPRIFEPFFTARPDGKGTGLGLAVVRQIVEEHKGSLVVESIPGAGSTFTLLLPAEASQLQEVPRGA